MSTVAPSKVQEFQSTTNEKIAYLAASCVPTVETNDQNRLGYHLWLMLTEKKLSLHEAIKQSGARILVAEREAIRLIDEQLRAAGIIY